MDSVRRAAWSSRNTYLVWCQIAYYYLRGYRRFRVNNWENAKVLVGYESDLGDLRFRNEDIREKYKTALGRFLKMNLSPEITKRSWGLDSIRKSSIAQVALDHELRFTDLKKVQSHFVELLLLYGTVGLAHWQYRDMDDKLQNEIEVIAPWEILPFPAIPTHLQELQGLQRYRKVPLKWLKNQAGMDIPSEHSKNKENELEVEKVYPGAQPSQEFLRLGDNSGIMGAGSFSKQTKPTGSVMQDEITELYVPLLETWVEGPDNTVARYIAKVGKHIAMDVSFDEGENKTRVPMPITTARYIPDTTFYSYGFVIMLLSGNHQEEKMLQNLYRNVEELDQYGTIFWPLTAGAGKNEFNKKNGRPKLVGYEPDYTVPDAKPFSLTPANTGDFPGRVASLAAQRQNNLANQGPLFQGQSMGRVDSAAGMGFAFEVSQISQAATAHEISNAWAQIYKSMLYSIKQTFREGDKLTVTNIDDNVAGIKIDEQGNVSLDNNPIPDYWEVKIDVKDREPKSTEARKQELLLMYNSELIDDVEFRFINWKEDLNFPVGNRGEFEAYRKATYNNIVLFGDGETPGQIHPDMFMDNPEIHLRVVRAFTARLEMTFASQAIRTAFTNLIQLLEGFLGGYPSGLPPMEQMAEEQMGGGQGAGPGGQTGSSPIPPTQQGPTAVQGGPGGPGLQGMGAF